jgi:hypothetical protein
LLSQLDALGKINPDGSCVRRPRAVIAAIYRWSKSMTTAFTIGLGDVT